MSNIKPEYQVFENVLAQTTLEDLDKALAELGAVKTTEQYSTIEWTGWLNGRRIKFKAYPSTPGKRSVQSYIWLGQTKPPSGTKLFDTFKVSITEEQTRALLSK